MKFVLNINCDNLYFAEDVAETVANHLLDISNIVRAGMSHHPANLLLDGYNIVSDGTGDNTAQIRDASGHVVGFFEFVNDLGNVIT